MEQVIQGVFDTLPENTFKNEVEKTAFESTLGDYFTNKNQLRTAVSTTSTTRPLVIEALSHLEVSEIRADVVLHAISGALESESTQETTSSSSNRGLGDNLHTQMRSMSPGYGGGGPMAGTSYLYGDGVPSMATSQGNLAGVQQGPGGRQNFMKFSKPSGGANSGERPSVGAKPPAKRGRPRKEEEAPRPISVCIVIGGKNYEGSTAYTTLPRTLMLIPGPHILQSFINDEDISFAYALVTLQMAPGDHLTGETLAKYVLHAYDAETVDDLSSWPIVEIVDSSSSSAKTLRIPSMDLYVLASAKKLHPAPVKTAQNIKYNDSDQRRLNYLTYGDIKMMGTIAGPPGKDPYHFMVLLSANVEVGGEDEDDGDGDGEPATKQGQKRPRSETGASGKEDSKEG